MSTSQSADRTDKVLDAAWCDPREMTGLRYCIDAATLRLRPGDT
jgi:peptide methionine sulfoxide reductase MsrB